MHYFEAWTWRASHIRTIATLTVAASGFFVYVYVQYGSIGAARQYFSGASLAVDQPDVFVEAAAGEQAIAKFQLRNLSATPVTIHGAETHCGCVALERFPIKILPRTARILQIGVRIGKEEDRYRLTELVKLFTSPSGTPVILRVNVRIHQRLMDSDTLIPQPDEQFSKVTKS